MPATIFDSASTTPNAVVDLSLVKVVDNPTPIVGRDVVFSLTLTNSVDFSPATVVVVRDLFPGGYQFVSASGDGSYADATGDWSVGSLAPGATANLQITATVQGTGSYLNAAEISSAGESDTDDTYGDGSGEDYDTATTTPTPAADLSLGMVVDDATPDVGQPVVFTLTLANAAGFSNATNVVVGDLLPAGYRFVSAAGAGIYDDAAGTWTVASVTAGNSAVVNITVTVLPAGPYLNVAEVSAADQPDTLDNYGDGTGDDYASADTVSERSRRSIAFEGSGQCDA